jgi:nucleotide-binding universal stress UspA family protein
MNPTLHKILAPVDFSPASPLSLSYAAELARGFGGTVHVIHAWEAPVYLRPDLTVWSGEVSATLGDQIRHAAEQAMREFLTKMALDANPAFTSEIIQGTPYKTILTAAEQGKFDILVMGTHGRTGLSHALLGSVAEKVVRHAPCPVLTVRAPAADQ